ncbi:hypothetical protein ABIF90_000858 [Bradyrhizobium japonicum]
MMMDENLALLRAHHNNISRYRRLLLPSFHLWNGSLSKGGFPRRRPLCKAFLLRPSRSPSRSQGPVDRCRLQR